MNGKREITILIYINRPYTARSPNENTTCTPNTAIYTNILCVCVTLSNCAVDDDVLSPNPDSEFVSTHHHAFEHTLRQPTDRLTTPTQTTQPTQQGNRIHAAPDRHDVVVLGLDDGRDARAAAAAAAARRQPAERRRIVVPSAADRREHARSHRAVGGGVRHRHAEEVEAGHALDAVVATDGVDRRRRQ